MFSMLCHIQGLEMVITTAIARGKAINVHKRQLGKRETLKGHILSMYVFGVHHLVMQTSSIDGYLTPINPTSARKRLVRASFLKVRE